MLSSLFDFGIFMVLVSVLTGISSTSCVTVYVSLERGWMDTSLAHNTTLI